MAQMAQRQEFHEKGENFQMCSSIPPLCSPSPLPGWSLGWCRRIPSSGWTLWGGLGWLFPPGDPRRGEPVPGWASSALRGLCHPGLGTLRAHQQDLLGVGGDTENIRGTNLIQLQSLQGEVSHNMHGVTKKSKYSMVCSCPQGYARDFPEPGNGSRARELFQNQGMAPGLGIGSRTREWFQSEGMVLELGKGSRAREWF